MGRFTIRKKFIFASVLPIILTVTLLAGFGLMAPARPAFWLMLSMATGFGIVVALSMSAVFSRSLIRPLQGMMGWAQQLSQGQPVDKIRIETDDELADIISALNARAQELERKIHTLSGERTQLAAILSGMIEGVMILDRHGTILMINTAMATMFQLTSSDVIGRSSLEVLRHASLIEFITRTLECHTSQSQELLIRTPQECFFHVQASVTPAGHEQENCGILVFHDVTGIKHLERVRKDFVANVSHELKTPLTAIKGYIEALLDGAKDDPHRSVEFLQILMRNTDRLTNIIADLLTLSHIESGQYRWKREPVMLPNLIESVTGLLRPLADKKHQRLSSTVPTVLLPVSGDPEQLTQALMNLVENAIKYTPEQGTITVEATQGDKEVEITVADTGLGISAKDLQPIFERFYRVDRARSRELGGTGLGLSIVKHIVESHGGTVRVDSEHGRGSRFIVTLPRECPSAHA